MTLEASQFDVYIGNPPEARIIPPNKHELSLCGSSELLIEYAMVHGWTILVDGHLLMKFNGKITALCVKNYTAPDGTSFKEGVWYSPRKKERRSFYKNEYAKGATALPYSDTEDWAEVRPQRDKYYSIRNGGERSKEELLADVRDYASRVTGKMLTPEKAKERTRKTYEEPYAEDYEN
jgi:hypothetical protein